jgi:hypothetical protein
MTNASPRRSSGISRFLPRPLTQTITTRRVGNANKYFMIVHLSGELPHSATVLRSLGALYWFRGASAILERHPIQRECATIEAERNRGHGQCQHILIAVGRGEETVVEVHE